MANGSWLTLHKYGSSYFFIPALGIGIAPHHITLNMSNTTTTVLPPHCVDPRSDAENAIVAVLGVLVIFISLHDFRTTYRSMYYAFDVRSTMTLMLFIPALYAMINIINVYISPVGTTILLMVDCQALIRVLYMFSLIKFTISVANAGNQQHGTFAAAVYHVGTFLERLQLKPLSLGGPPCCKILWCKCSYIPGKAFLGQCVTRVYVALTLQGILMVVRQAMIDTAIEKQYSMLLTVWGLAVTFLALSAKMPLDALMQQILSPMPRQQFVAKWRNYQYQMWFVLIGGLHNVSVCVAVVCCSCVVLLCCCAVVLLCCCVVVLLCCCVVVLLCCCAVVLLCCCAVVLLCCCAFVLLCCSLFLTYVVFCHFFG
jgi:hypothetical protein